MAGRWRPQITTSPRRLLAAKGVNTLQENPDVEEIIGACWDFVAELKRGRRGLTCTRQGIADMVNAMLVWESPALGFIRKVRPLPLCTP